MWIDEIKKSKNKKVLVMLSGGKDSTATLLMLKNKGLDVTAIHFFHKWSSEISTNEAKRICNKFNIPLILCDFSKEFFNAIDGYTNGRPCLICKRQMYNVLLKKIKPGSFGYLAIGDNANDRTTIARLKEYIGDLHNNEYLECSSYFGSELGVKLHKGMKVLRPLIKHSANEIEKLLTDNKIVINRINSTGDKYFEYHREGCPVQFADVGTPITIELLNDLKLYNDKITEFAREKEILASIHMPSKFIITIPKRYEKSASDYMTSEGLAVDSKCNSIEDRFTDGFYCFIKYVSDGIFENKSYVKIADRMAERLEIYKENFNYTIDGKHVLCKIKNEFLELNISFDFTQKQANIVYLFSEKSKSIKELSFFNNLILELFRTRRYYVFRKTK